MMGDETEQIRLLREMLKWIRFAGMKEVKTVLLSTLDSAQKKTIYQLSDGDKSSAEIAKASGVSDWTVRNYWKSWANAGIVEALKAGRGDRYKRAFDLKDFAIEVAELNPDAAPGKEAAAKQAAMGIAEQTKIE